MTEADLSARLASLDREISEVGEQQILYSIFNPIPERHRQLIEQRESVRAKLRSLSASATAH